VSTTDPQPDGVDLRHALAISRALLEPVIGRDWSVPIPDLDWTVGEAVGHIAEACLWYATDLAARGRELHTMRLDVDPTVPPDELLATLAAFTEVLIRVVESTAPDVRGYHPFGMADASGFVAMACDEMLVHTFDAACGLGLEFEPDASLCARTLVRLFPEAPADVAPWPALLWTNGRIELPDRPRRERWRWHCAPPEEWRS
jgi:uncharacterized protein (TIGR03083 family)